MGYSPAEVKKIFESSKSERDLWDSLYKDAYEYAIPNRDMMNKNTSGANNNSQIFDSTAIDSTSSFANFLHDSLTPPEYRWMEYTAGSDVPEAQRYRVQTLLDAVTEKFFSLLGSTNFDNEINQAYHDLAAGMGVIGIRDYGKFGQEADAATFIAAPPYEIYVAEGRESHLSTIMRVFSIEPERVKVIWPDANYDTEFEKVRSVQSIDNKKNFIEISYYDYDTKMYRYSVMRDGADEFILDEERTYAPWIVFRWSVVSGERYGRGPLLNAMPDIKTCNKVVELSLQNASLALSGVYTAVDDGVLNPNSVEISPGSIIPVAYNGGQFGKSLDVLPRNGDFDLSNLLLTDLRQSIRRKLFDDDIAPLDEAVRSSKEVALRQQMASRRAGPSFGRLRTELLTAAVINLTLMWQEKGLLPPFKIDGKTITVRFTSPLSKQQASEDLNELDMFVARMNTFQQGMAPMVIKPEEYTHYVANKTGIPINLIHDKETLVQGQKQLGQVMAQGGPAAEAMAEIGG